jgi:4-amino-4-deoxy-L-arabinose transferase-like glycosyltransferase
MSDADVAAPSRAGGTRQPASRPTSRPTDRSVVALLALATVLLRLPAFFASRHLVFDDGTYGVSVLDMRHGLAPYTGVFSAQGPLHFPLLYVGDLIGLRTINGPRVTPMLAGVAATVATWAIARRIGGPKAGVIAGALVATSGSMIWTTGQGTGDGPAAALAVGAVWAALVYRDEPRLRRAVVTGLVMGAALAVKPLLLPAAVPVGWWLWSRRRLDHLAAAIGTAVGLWLACAVPWGLGNVWRQSVTYNTGAGPHYAKLGQLNKLLSTLGSRDLLVVGALLFALITALVTMVRAPRNPHDNAESDPERATRRADVTVIALWAGVTAIVLVLEPALYRNHLAAIVPPLALLAAILTLSPRVLVVLLILLVPWSAHNLRSILAPTGYRGDAAAVMYTLRSLPDDAQVISDEPGFVYRAGLRTPKLMNDPSVKRIDQHLLTTASVARAASDPRLCAVVVWSSRFGRDLPGLPAALRRAGLVRADTYRGVRALWLRSPCNP